MNDLRRSGLPMLPHPLTSFEIQKYYKNEPKLNGVYSRSNLPKTKDGTYIKTLDEYKSIGTHWISLHLNGKNIMYFDIFGVEHVPRKIEKLIENKNIIANNYKTEACDSIMCRYFRIGFIVLMLKGKRLLDGSNLFSPMKSKK